MIYSKINVKSERLNRIVLEIRYTMCILEIARFKSGGAITNNKLQISNTIYNRETRLLKSVDFLRTFGQNLYS